MARLPGTGRAIVALLAVALAACQPAPLPSPAAPLEAPRPTPRPTLPDRPEPGGGGRMPCLDGCAMSNGDPHLVTVDGTGYDFQAAGEFVMLRSPDGSVEIQARQEPYPDTNNVAVNTAVALRVDGQRVGVYSDRDSGMWATLDGELIDGVAATPIGTGGAITPLQGDGYEIALADGTYVYAVSVGIYGINLLIEPSAELAAAGQGALASVPPDSMGVPALPDGSALPPAADAHAYYESLYVRFADAWRVRPESALFDYEDGQSTADFTIAGYPREENLMGLGDLTDGQRTAGEAACASISEPPLHGHCVFDVGITADPGFADSYLSTLTLIDSGALPETAARARLVNLYLADGQPADVDVYAYSWEEEVGEVASLVASVPYGTVSDWFNPGLIDSPFGEPYSRLEFYRRGDQSNRLMEFSEVGPGTQTTIAIWTEEGISGEPSAWLQAIHQKHPEFPVQGAPPAAGMLVTRNVGLLAGEDDPPLLYASVGDGCLTSVFEEPGGVGPQPIGNDLLLPLGSHTLTVHSAPEFEAPECDTEPAGPGTPITVSDGDRFMLYLYAPPGQQEISQLLIPFGR